jgi:hypothetical protein
VRVGQMQLSFFLRHLILPTLTRADARPLPEGEAKML